MVQASSDEVLRNRSPFRRRLRFSRGIFGGAIRLPSSVKLPKACAIGSVLSTASALPVCRPELGGCFPNEARSLPRPMRVPKRKVTSGPMGRTNVVSVDTDRTPLGIPARLDDRRRTGPSHASRPHPLGRPASRRLVSSQRPARLIRPQQQFFPLPRRQTPCGGDSGRVQG